MSKELKALETIRKALEIAYPLMYEEENEMPEYLNIIETTLKDYEQYEKILKDYGFNLANFREACFTLAQFRGEGFTGIEKELKALETIKNEVNIVDANNTDGTKQKALVMVVLDNNKNFDLLKKVLK